jgi:hypothetical protein
MPFLAPRKLKILADGVEGARLYRMMQLQQLRASTWFLLAVQHHPTGTHTTAAACPDTGLLRLPTFPAVWVDGCLQVTCSSQRITMTQSMCHRKIVVAVPNSVSVHVQPLHTAVTANSDWQARCIGMYTGAVRKHGRPVDAVKYSTPGVQAGTCVGRAAVRRAVCRRVSTAGRVLQIRELRNGRGVVLRAHLLHLLMVASGVMALSALLLLLLMLLVGASAGGRSTVVNPSSVHTKHLLARSETT